MSVKENSELVTQDRSQHEGRWIPLTDTEGRSAASQEFWLWGSAGAQAARRLTQHSAPRTAMQCELRSLRFSVQTVSASQFHKNTPQQRV